MVKSGHMIREIPRFISFGFFPPGSSVATFFILYLVKQDNFTHTHTHAHTCEDTHRCLRNIKV